MSIALSAFISVFSLGVLFAQTLSGFTGEVNADNINIRADSTVASEVICSIDKGRQVEVVSELYDWYKIRLPKNAPSYIKKNFAGVLEDNPADSIDKFKNMDIEGGRAAKVSADRVNIRLSPGESSAILGRAGKDEVITILQEKGDWYKIEPIHNSFGWINKKFVNKAAVTKKTGEEGKPDRQVLSSENVTIEGLIRPYGIVIKRPATHKLITSDKNIFLLKGDKKSIDALNNHKARVIGKLISPDKGKLSIIEVEKIEGLE